MFIVNKFNVEVRKEDGGLYPLLLLDINPSGDEQLFRLKSEESAWLPDQWVPASSVELFEAPQERSHEELRERLQPNCQVEALYSVKQGAPVAWYPGQLLAEKAGIYTVNLQLNPPRPVNLFIEQLRMAHDPVPVSNIQRFVYDVRLGPPEVVNEKYLKLLADAGRLKLLRYDPDEKLIIIVAPINSPLTLQFIHILYIFHDRHAKQRQQQLDDKAKVQREMLGVERQPKQFICEFDVPRYPPEGSYAQIIHNARQLTGIVRIIADPAHIKIIAVDENVMNEARQMLEITKEIMFVESDLIRHIIGKKGDNVRMIINQTGIISLSIFDNEAEMDKFYSKKMETEWVEGCAAVILHGPKCSVENAKMLIQFQIDTAREIDQERPDRRRPTADRGSRQGGQLSRQSTEDRGTEQNAPVVAPVENGISSQQDAKNAAPRFPGPRRNSQNRSRDDGERSQHRENFNGERRDSRRNDNGYSPDDTRQFNGERPRGNGEDDFKAGTDGPNRRRSVPNGRPEDQNQRPPNFNRRSSNRGRRGGYSGSGDYRNGPLRDAGDNNTNENAKLNSKQNNSNPAPQVNGHPAVDEEGFVQARSKNRKNRPRQPGAETIGSEAGDQ